MSNTVLEQPAVDTQRRTGRVRWFNANLGYGFIAVAPSVKREFDIDPEFDLFFHAKEVRVKFPKKLEADQSVTFNVVIGSKGPRAINVEAAAE